MIRVLSAGEAGKYLPSLSELLIDAVDSGASIGFLPPLERAEADAYWQTVIEAIESGSRELIAAWNGEQIVGAVQLMCETRANGRHRAEAGKLFVHRSARRRGLARALLVELERIAAAREISLLLMDTRKGGEAERLCESMGYTRWGEVPGYARSSNGELHTTVFYYRQLA